MTPETYVKNCLRTKTGIKTAVTQNNEDLLHAIMGIGSEAGELTEQVKKHLFYGRPLDVINIKEELGDCLWYIAILCDWLDCTFEELMDKNIEKLSVRYPDIKWSQDKALNRDTKKERKALI